MKNLGTYSLLMFLFFLSTGGCSNSKVDDKKKEFTESEKSTINSNDTIKQVAVSNPVDSTIQKLKEPIKSIVENIQWFGQAGVKIISDEKVIYIDPYDITSEVKADYIFITHAHDDHFSMYNIKKIATNKTIFVAPKDCIKEIQSTGYSLINEVEPEMNLKLGSVNAVVVPAYNEGKNFHPKENNWVGYVLEINGTKIYHPGDTDRIPEMQKINCDIAFMPLGQTYTMDSVSEAVSAVIDVKAKVAIPIHYGIYEGTEQDAQTFKSLLAEKVTVIIKNRH